jgi:type I restriction enzyme R subunit
MSEIDKRTLTERNICTKFINPALESAGWDLMRQIREEYFFTDGQVIVKGKSVKRGERKFADYVLFYKPNIPIAIIEAKDNTHGISAGMQPGLSYAERLDIPYVFSTNGDGFLFHDRLAKSGAVETELALDAFPSPGGKVSCHRDDFGIDDDGGGREDVQADRSRQANSVDARKLRCHSVSPQNAVSRTCPRLLPEKG